MLRFKRIPAVESTKSCHQQTPTQWKPASFVDQSIPNLLQQQAMLSTYSEHLHSPMMSPKFFFQHTLMIQNKPCCRIITRASDAVVTFGLPWTGHAGESNRIISDSSAYLYLDSSLFWINLLFAPFKFKQRWHPPMSRLDTTADIFPGTRQAHTPTAVQIRGDLLQWSRGSTELLGYLPGMDWSHLHRHCFSQYRRHERVREI